MWNEIKKRLPGFDLSPITESNFEQAMEVYRANRDFFILTQGREATYENSVGDITAVPPDFEAGNKLYVGIWENGEIVAVLDILLGYPARQHIWIGLLIVHGDLHNKAYGGKIVTAVTGAASALGYEAIQLGVIENNEIGIRFWRKQGFEKIRTAENVLVMEKRLLCKDGGGTSGKGDTL